MRPDQAYWVKMEALGIDFSAPSYEYVSNITLNGENFGSCAGNCDQCCTTYFDCSNIILGHGLTKNSITANSGRINIELTYTSGALDFECSWQNITANALARIALTPMQGKID